MVGAYPYSLLTPHFQVVFKGGVHEFGWALSLYGFAGSQTPA